MESCTLLTCLIIVVVQFMCFSVVQSMDTICAMKGCNCNTASNHGLRITCNFNQGQKIEISPGFIPKETEELELWSGAEVGIRASAFSNLSGLQRLAISNVTELVLAKNAFFNLLTTRLFLDITHCGNVIIETGAFRASRGPVSLLIAHCAAVLIHSSSLSWILSVYIRECPSLVLQELAFSQETHTIGRHGPSTTISLEKVRMAEVPRNTFISAASELRVIESEIGTIRSEAFSATNLYSVEILNSTVGTVEESGFSDRTLIGRLTLSHTLVHSLESNSLRSAITNLTIQHSRVIDAKREAINCLTVAIVKLSSNQFDKIQTRGFALKNWNRISIENNTFLQLEDNAFKSLYTSEASIDRYEFNFTNNNIKSIGENALNFSIKDSFSLEVKGNTFERGCNCDFDSWLALVVSGSNRAIDAFRNTSLCKMSHTLAQCHRLPEAEGFFSARNFINSICALDNPECVPTNKGSIVPLYDPGSSNFLNLVFSKNIDTRNLVLVSFVIFVVCLVSSLMVIWSVRWVKHSRVRSKSDLLKSSKSFSRFSLLSRFFSSGLTSASSTHSISRMSIHEYAELHRQKLQEEEELGLGIPLEDKATQTLPEEFTQELLQSLKEKLEDPDKSVEARVIIEHLYDMIKVEESCDNNLIDSSFDIDELYNDNVYDTIRPPKRHRLPSDRTFKSTVSVGTRVPSPDKLEPIKLCKAVPQVPKSTPKPTICEYNDPKDVERHVYLELPHKAPPPSQPYFTTVGQCQSLRFHPTVLSSVLCDYNEPKDTTVHVYSEVPLSMVNRPLPIKPGQTIIEDIEEATSSGYSSR